MSILADLRILTPENFELPQAIDDVIHSEVPFPKNSDSMEFSLVFPLKEISRYWYPANNGIDSLPNLWTGPMVVSTNYSMPIFVFFNELGENRLTISLNETLRKVEVSIGVHEESASMIASFSFPEGLSSEKLMVQLDGRKQPFYQSVVKNRTWIYDQKEYQLLPYNEAAYKPVYSTWYSYHQALTQANIEEQAQDFKKYHLETLILDDGWQTEDSSRRYAFAGDWEIAQNKFPTMIDHVGKIKSQGIKYMVWVTLPYIGEKTQAFSRFKDKFLYFDTYQKAGVLDPRYPDVRAYLVNKIVTLVKELDLDGLKIDFVDSFKEIDTKKTVDMDITNLEESINTLLAEIMTICLSDNPEFLVEFREDYYGPNMVQYCNIMRVKDCPNDFNKNRVGLTNIRLLAPSVAPHGDMLLFHLEDNLTSVTLQFLNCLYGVVQLSVDLVKLNSEQAEIITFWLDYQMRNQKVLLHQDFVALNPHLGYNFLGAGSNDKWILTSYQTDQVIHLDKSFMAKQVDIINASLSNYLIIATDDFLEEVAFEIFNLKGQKVDQGQLKLTAIQKIAVPACGLLVLTEI
ncbi:alpha-galactosidase [Enterococcus italicus]|uniref:glycoside hydrolase family 36 protein n=1 Tax=Enterococcus italicus TaxID=246144 RepID=UPI0020737453|nr:glycoside hydrolase family 36 protein [Enterococcus italicus]MCM6881230.1 alpha-galactosidase [Enterococcus italicus]